MEFKIPPSTEEYGFATDGLGAHSGRTIMSGDLRLLLAACPPSAQIEDYKDAILNSNILLKKTIAARKESFSRLKRLYGLDQEIYLIKVLRNLWEHDTNSAILAQHLKLQFVGFFLQLSDFNAGFAHLLTIFTILLCGLVK